MMMQPTEPMALGSPGSPAGPGMGMTQSPFLPAFLMGEPSPMNSSQPRMWSAGGGVSGHSPPKAHRSMSIGSPTSPTSAPFGHTARIDRTSEMLRSRKDKTGAPPVSGLLEDIASPAGPMDRSKLDMSHSRVHGTSFYGTPHQEDSLLYAPNMSTLNTSTLNTSRRAPASPAQIDPFYSQGENIGPEDHLDETWITVFGFPAAAASFILQQFSQYGNILKHVVATDGNWLHIKYQSKLQAKKALSKNGKVFGNSIMVGVAPCIDKRVMENLNTTGHILNTPTQASLPNTPLNASQKNTPIRPLTAAYRAVASERQVTAKANTPQKNNGLVTKAMEYIFGW